MPPAIARADELPHIPAGPLRRGFADADVQEVLGLNALRLLERIWKP